MIQGYSIFNLEAYNSLEMFNAQFKMITEIEFKKGAKLSMNCLDPSIVMQEIQELNPRSIIVASGTLSPQDAF